MELGERGTELYVPLASGRILPTDEVRQLLDTEPAAGCQQADTCPAAGRGHWLRHTDKDGQRTTVHNSDGTFWNRACPVRGCSVKVFG